MSDVKGISAELALQKLIEGNSIYIESKISTGDISYEKRKDTAVNGQHPYGTLLCNILGCFVLGLLTKLSPGDAQMKLLLTTGFCGGFTTFSTFMNESLFMLRGGQLFVALAYMALSLVLGLICAWVGYNIVR